MSVLYEIEVSRRPDPVTVELYVQVVHPDAMHIYDTPGFSLMLLQECQSTGNLLAGEVDYQTVMDAQWLKKYAQGFIKKVSLGDLGNEMPAAARDDYDHEFWQEPYAWTYGTLTIQVTDPAWLAHVPEGLSWESAAYDPNRHYDACGPILYNSEKEENEVVAEAEIDYSEGFIPVPTVFFEHTRHLPGPFMWIPIYGKNAYLPAEKLEGDAITDELLTAWMGKTVVFEGTWADSPGIITSTEMMFSFTEGSHGEAGISAEGFDYIGLATFNRKKKRLKPPFTYAKLFNRINPLISKAEVQGNTAVLTVYKFSSYADPGLPSASNALGLLTAPICDVFETFQDTSSKLAQFLEKEMESREIKFVSDLYSLLAGGMILTTKVEKISEASYPDLDALDNATRMEWLSKKPWHTWRLEIEVSDPAWIEHLPTAAPFAFNFGWMDEAEAWEGELLTWKG